MKPSDKKDATTIIASVLIPAGFIFLIKFLNLFFSLSIIVTAIIFFVLGLAIIPLGFIFIVNNQAKKVEKKLEKAEGPKGDWVQVQEDFEMEGNILLEGVFKLQYGKRKKYFKISMTNDHLFMERKKKGSQRLSVNLKKIIVNSYAIEKGSRQVLEIDSAIPVFGEISLFNIYMDTTEEVEKWKKTLKFCAGDKQLIRQVWEPSVYPGKETAVFLNAIIHRFWLNWRESPDFIERVHKKLYSKLNSNIEKKGYDSFIHDMVVKDVDVGQHPPTLTSAMLYPADQLGDLKVDLSLSYKGGGFSCSLSTVITLPILGKKVDLPVEVDVTVVKFSGHLQLRTHPYPHNQYSVSFYDDPEMEFDIHLSVGNHMKGVLPKIEKLVKNRIKLAFVQKMVRPNRRSFRIPSTEQGFFAELETFSGSEDPSSDESPDYQ